MTDRTAPHTESDQTASIKAYLDDLASSDRNIRCDNAIDLIVLNYAITPDEAGEAFQQWTKSKRNHR